MGRKLALLTTSTALAFAAALVTAAPAQARNIGGLLGVCTFSPGGTLGPPSANGAGQAAGCLCLVVPNTTIPVAGPTGPGSKCPPGILRLQPAAPKPTG